MRHSTEVNLSGPGDRGQGDLSVLFAIPYRAAKYSRVHVHPLEAAAHFSAVGQFRFESEKTSRTREYLGDGVGTGTWNDWRTPLLINTSTGAGPDKGEST